MRGNGSGGAIKIPARASMWYIGASVTAKAIGMLMTPAFTRLLSGAEYGEYALYMSWLGLSASVATGIIPQSVIYKGMQKFEGMNQGYVTAVIGAAAVASTAVGLAVGGVGMVLGLSARLLPTLALQLLFDSVIGVYSARERYGYSYRGIVTAAVLQAVGAPIISVVLIRYAGLGGDGRIYGLLLSAMVVFLVITVRCVRYGGRFYDGEVWRFALGRSARLVPYLLAGAVIAQADRLMISVIHGETVLGRYSVAHTVGMGLSFVVSGVGASLTPWIMRKLRAGRVLAVRNITTIAAMGLCAAAVFVVAIAPEAIGFLAPREYSEAVLAVMPIALSAVPSFTVSVSTAGAIFAEGDRGVSLAAIPGAITGIGLGGILIPRFLYVGAAASGFFAGLVMAIGAYAVLRKCGLGDIIDIKRIGYYFAFTVGWCGIVVLFYRMAAVRILLLIPAAIALTRTAFEIKDVIVERGT